MPEREAHVEFHLPIMDLPQWVIWRYEQRAGKEKPTKVPYQPRRPGLKAASTRAHEWGTYGEAIEAAATADGVGFVFARGDGYVGVDLDDCRDPQTGKLKAWARDIIDRLPSYAEISPSGRGVHIYARGHLPEGGRKVGPVEIYDQGRYFTFTGQPLPGSPLDIAEQQDAIETLYAELAPEEPPTAHNDGPPEPLRLDDAEVIRRAMGAKNGDKFRRLWQGDIGGYPSQSEAEMALASMLAFWVGRDQAAIDRLMRQSGLYRPKWDEKHFTDGRTYGQATAARAASTTAETFGTRQHVGQIIQRVATPDQVDPETGEIIELTGRELLGQAIRDSVPDVQWWVEPVVVHGRIHMVYGEPESGKTILVLAWVLDIIARGNDVLFIDEESGIAAVAGLLKSMHADPETVDRHVHYFPFPGIDKDRYAALLAYADRLSPALCVFDSLTDMLAVAGLDENSGIEVTSWMLGVAQALARRTYQPGVVLIDHVTKDTSNVKYSVASRAKKAKSDVLWYIEKKDDFDQSKTAHVEIHRHKNRPGVLPKKLTYVMGGEDGRLICEPFDPSRHAILSWPIGARRMLDYIIENGGEAPTRDIARVFAVSRETVGKWGKWLLAGGYVERFGESVAAGFRASDRGWESVNPDAKSVNPDAAIASGKASDLAPSYRGHLTLFRDGDESLATASQEDDLWN